MKPSSISPPEVYGSTCQLSSTYLSNLVVRWVRSLAADLFRGLLLNCIVVVVLQPNTNRVVSNHGFRSYYSCLYFIGEIVFRMFVGVVLAGGDSEACILCITLSAGQLPECTARKYVQYDAFALDLTHPFVFLLILSISIKLRRCRFCHNSNKLKNG
jgi:hypothetical protein